MYAATVQLAVVQPALDTSPDEQPGVQDHRTRSKQQHTQERHGGTRTSYYLILIYHMYVKTYMYVFSNRPVCHAPFLFSAVYRADLSAMRRFSSALSIEQNCLSCTVSL